MYAAKILADSVNTHCSRLTTMEVTYPLCVHAEHLRHRVFSLNVASARAIPVAKTIEKIKYDTFLPVYWGKNKAGMSASEEIPLDNQEVAQQLILKHRDATVALMEKLVALGVHKQTVNRYAAPFQYVQVIVSGTEWDNFFNLRCHPDAQPEIRKIAEMMRTLYETNIPALLSPGQWHMPMLSDKLDLLAAGYSLNDCRMIAAGRCARISYETHHGSRDPAADIKLFHSLMSDKHYSPAEHIAECADSNDFVRNFRGWRQLRTLHD